MPRYSTSRALAPFALASLGLLACGASSIAQSVELRVVERSNRSVVDGAATAQLILAVQARIVNAPSACFLASFGFSVRIVGEPEGFGSFSRMVINNADGTYSSAFAVSSVVGRGGIAAQYAYLAGINSAFNGVLNASTSTFTNTPDQEILSIAGVAQGSGLLGVPGMDLDGDGTPDTSPSNGMPTTDNGTLCPVPAPIRNDYLGAAGSWIDIYRFRYTVSNFAPRLLVFKVENATGSIADSIMYNLGLWGPCTGGGSFVPVTRELAVSVFTTAPAACCDPSDNSCIVRPINECPALSVAGESSCAPSSCPAPGVCCDSGGCRAAYASPCTGSWIAGGTCIANPCPPMGACCAPNGACTAVPRLYCPFVTRQTPNSWRSGGTCNPNTCPQPGACCGEASCEVTPSYKCNGRFVGPGTTCEAGTGCPARTCCDAASGTCQWLLHASHCPAGFTSPSSHLVGCSPNPCPVASCCAPLTGQCVVMGPEGFCAAPGNLVLGQACASSTCSWIVCCTPPTGACTLIPPMVACSGTAMSAVRSCTPTPCPSVACCDPISATCTTIGPSGLCPTGTVSQGPSTCLTVTCPGLLCCAPDGQCSVIGTAAVCPGNLAPQASQTSCTSNPCPIAGTCCLIDGTCQMIVQSLCNGQWTTTGRACDQYAPCPSLVWCCSGTGTLTQIAPFACAGVQIAAVGCGTHSCEDAGACCTGRVCSITFPSGCAAPGAIFSRSTACTSGFGLCCRVDFDRSGGVGMADLFSFLSAWMVGDLQTDFDQDGQLASSDVVAFIAAWSQGC